ncbi:MAG: hypothetical protein GC179_30205 [Anaerolineaceae bacterium]|nr:hypothetical protein [Anaerolineaceae bacterium]
MFKFLFSILLNAIGIGLLLAVIIVPGMPQFRNDKRVDSLLGIILCNQGEQLVRQASNNPALSTVGITITPYCISRSGQSRDVTTRWLLIGLGGFGFTMLFGVVLDIMLLLNGFRRAVMHLSIKRNRLPSFSTTPSMPPSDDLALSLKDKLKQLDDVHLSGSISDDEYRKMRQEILDKT